MSHDNEPYLLQCIRLGMLLQDPNELDHMEAWHFADPVLRVIVEHLKSRRLAFKENKTGFNGTVDLAAYLESLGCEHGIQSVEDARSAIRDTVEADGMFARAVEKLSEITECTVNRRMPNAAKRRFAELVNVDWKTGSER